MSYLEKESQEKVTYLQFNINILYYLGLWQFNNTPTFRKIFNYIIVFSILLQLMIFYVTEFIDFYLNFGDIQIMTKLMSQVTANTLLIYRIIYYLHNHKQLEKLLVTLKYNLTQFARKNDQQKLMEECDKRLKIFTIVYIMLGVVVASFWIIIPFIDHNSEGNALPFETWTPFDISDPQLYVLAYIGHALHAVIFIIYMPSSSIFMFGLIYHACIQFRILHNSLISVNFEEPRFDCLIPTHKKTNINFKANANIKECIIHHQTILR